MCGSTKKVQRFLKKRVNVKLKHRSKLLKEEKDYSKFDDQEESIKRIVSSFAEEVDRRSCEEDVSFFELLYYLNLFDNLEGVLGNPSMGFDRFLSLHGKKEKEWEYYFFIGLGCFAIALGVAAIIAILVAAPPLAALLLGMIVPLVIICFGSGIICKAKIDKNAGSNEKLVENINALKEPISDLFKKRIDVKYGVCKPH